MKILYQPASMPGNIVVNIFRECLSKAGNDVVSCPSSHKKIMFTNCDAIYTQWFENLPSNRNKAIKMFLLKIITIIVLKIRGKKIFFVMHNKISHDKSVAKASSILLKFILKNSDKIFILSRASNYYIEKCVGKVYYIKKQIRNKTFYIPHPNYINAYPIKNLNHFSGLKTLCKDDFVVMNIGMVRPYKNLEILIKAFKKANLINAKLIIAGKPSSIEYKEELIKLINNDNRIILYLDFVKDENLVELLKYADILVFPYSKRSSLNSGSIYLACSYATTFIAPPIATVQDLHKIEDSFYQYDYSDNFSHIDELSKIISMAYTDYNFDKPAYEKKGIELRQFIEKNNSKERLIEAYKIALNI